MSRRTNPPRNELLEKLGRVDWLRAMQRVSVFLRDWRGDDPADIQDDHITELERSQKLRRTTTEIIDHLGTAPSASKRR